MSELLYGLQRGMAPSRAQFISPSWAELHWGSSSFSPSTIKGSQTTPADLHIPADDMEIWMDGTWPGITLSLSKPEDFFHPAPVFVYFFYFFIFTPEGQKELGKTVLWGCKHLGNIAKPLWMEKGVSKCCCGASKEVLGWDSKSFLLYELTQA